jgi:acetyl-CoA acyltransferase 2
MSQAPHIIRGARRGLALSQGALEDSLWESLHDSFINTTMAVTAENLAAKYKISQEEVDNFCLKSQQNYQQACARGVFTDEIAPISCKITKNTMLLDYDEHPRPDTSLAALQKLPKIFKAEGVIHAAAASGICDGAAALLMCTESFAHEHALKPLAELISFGMSGCDPNLMGIGPVSAIKICLERAELNLDHITMIEINEAFAPQVLAVLKELEIRRDINIHGGALAIGHPLAASGARISAHLAHSLKDQPHALGVGAACIGGGQGIAVLLRSLGA